MAYVHQGPPFTGLGNEESGGRLVDRMVAIPAPKQS